MTVVVGYSPSGQGAAALRSAAREAVRGKDLLVIASHPYHDAERGLSVASAAHVAEELARVGAGDLEVEIRTSGEQADIGDFLLQVADEAGARLLVIGLRRKSPIGKLNLGTSARRVVLGAGCPVLTVKDDGATTSGALPIVEAAARV